MAGAENVALPSLNQRYKVRLDSWVCCCYPSGVNLLCVGGVAQLHPGNES